MVQKVGGPRGPRADGRTRRWVLFAAVVIACGALLTLKRGGPSTGVVADLAAPVQRGLAMLGRRAAGVWESAAVWRRAGTENARLRQDNARLELAALAAGELAAENQRLRQLLVLQRRVPVDTLAADVIGRDVSGWGRTVTIDRGAQDRLEPLTAAVVPAGLVGRVVRVQRSSAVVQLLSDPASTVGAVAVTARTQGLVEGDARGGLRFKYLARDGAGLAVGELVATSGVGGTAPRGLPVGRIAALSSATSRALDAGGAALFRYAVLMPAADLGRLDEVLLVMGDRRRDLSALFGGQLGALAGPGAR